jgi:hypothetical protein
MNPLLRYVKERMQNLSKDQFCSRWWETTIQGCSHRRLAGRRRRLRGALGHRGQVLGTGGRRAKVRLWQRDSIMLCLQQHSSAAASHSRVNRFVSHLFWCATVASNVIESGWKSSCSRIPLTTIRSIAVAVVDPVEGIVQRPSIASAHRSACNPAEWWRFGT